MVSHWSRDDLVSAPTRVTSPGDGDAEFCDPGCMMLRDAGAYRLIWQPLSVN